MLCNRPVHRVTCENVLAKMLNLDLIKPLDISSVYRRYRENHKEVTQVGHSPIQLNSVSSTSHTLLKKGRGGVPFKIKRSSRDIIAKCN